MAKWMMVVISVAAAMTDLAMAASDAASDAHAAGAQASQGITNYTAANEMSSAEVTANGPLGTSDAAIDAVAARVGVTNRAAASEPMSAELAAEGPVGASDASPDAFAARARPSRPGVQIETAEGPQRTGRSPGSESGSGSGEP